MLHLHIPTAHLCEINPTDAKNNSAELAALDSPPLGGTILQAKFEEAQQH